MEPLGIKVDVLTRLLRFPFLDFQVCPSVESRGGDPWPLAEGESDGICQESGGVCHLRGSRPQSASAKGGRGAQVTAVSEEEEEQQRECR